MRRFQASERAVLRALEELQRMGRIVRRHGAGTFVAEPSQPPVTPILPPALTDSRTIVAIARPDSSFFDRCVELLFRYAEEADLTLVCRPVNPQTPLSLTPPPGAGQPLGFILFQYQLAPLARELQAAGCRVVVVGAPPAEVTPDVPCIYGDHEYGGYLATRHLLELGHRRLAFAGDYDLEQTLRWRGHLRALREAERRGIEIHATIFRPHQVAGWSREPELAAACFAARDAPTGVVVWNDHQATSLLSVLTRAGVKVPEEVSLVGYDALPEGERVYPPLSTVDHAIGQQLQAALSLLTRPAPPPPSHSVVVLPTLVVRESSAPPSGTDKVTR
jgi:DNA-binding LacI/PurR family transcriptional regulator